MLEQGVNRDSRSNLVLWVTVTALSAMGLGADAYKIITGEPIRWIYIISEAVIFIAAGSFVLSYFRRKRKKEEAENNSDKAQN